MCRPREVSTYKKVWRKDVLKVTLNSLIPVELKLQNKSEWREGYLGTLGLLLGKDLSNSVTGRCARLIAVWRTDCMVRLDMVILATIFKGI